MRRILFIVVLLVSANSLFAKKDITKFMGIPVDGLKSEMIQKLKEKGVVSSINEKDILEGEFNETQVNVFVVTNNNKVYRIMIYDKHQVGATDIKIRFNNLCQQFQNNPHYISFYDYTIADDENIAYELTVNDKRYEAVYYQEPLMSDSTEIANMLKARVLEKYNQQELDNPTEEIKKDLSNMALDCVKEVTLKKPVWFIICKYMRKYFISMFYNNEYNRANGEDL